jgi:hypothetical protein
VLTGDIHTGRHAVATIAGHTDAFVHEFVASPASLVGPFQPMQKPLLPPAAVAAKPLGWDIDVTEDVSAPTVANNVGVVQLTPGRNGRTRLRFEIWRVREYDSRRYWERLVGRKRPEGGLRLLMTKEVELR